jgi:hypothetical protein
MLIALSITAMLLTAALVALDASFKSYKMTSDSASTHVVTRIIVHRISTMIRTGRDFGPYPLDVLNPADNPLESLYIEFVSGEDPVTGFRQITRIEVVPDTAAGNGTQMLNLVMTQETSTNPVVVERPLLRGVTDGRFTLEYDIGPVLKQATIDLTVLPDTTASIHGDLEAPTIRFVTSARPRQLPD